MEREDILTLHRIINAPPERVFRAFTEVDALSKWFAPNGYTAKINQLEPIQGGCYDITLTHFGTGEHYHFKGYYLEIEQNQRIYYADQLYDAQNAEAGVMTEKIIEFKPSFMGTEISIQQTGLSAIQPREACYLDWQQSLYLLEKLVSLEH